MRVTLSLAALLVAASASWLNATGMNSSVTGFLLAGTAQHAQDPQNRSNDVIKIDTTSPEECSPAGGYQNCASGSVSRKVNVKIQQLDNMLEFKSFYANRSCGGGSPRIQLAIDVNGDGVADGNVFGHVESPVFSNCASVRWANDDVTDEDARWDVTQLIAAGLFPALNTICTLPVFVGNPTVCPPGGFAMPSGYIPWAVMEAGPSTLYPARVSDRGPCRRFPRFIPSEGVAYFDVISMGRKTWYSFSDTAGRGFARGCIALFHCEDDNTTAIRTTTTTTTITIDWWGHDREQKWGEG